MIYNKGGLIPGINRKEASEETKALIDIAEGKRTSVVFTYMSKEKASNKARMLSNFRKRHEFDEKIWLVQIVKQGNSVFLFREKKESRGK